LIAFTTPYDVNWLPQTLRIIFDTGFLGVDLFFILSGAVIAGSALQKDAASFAIARFFRLFPTYFVAVISATIFLPLVIDGYANRVTYLHALFSMQFWSGDQSIVGVAYTLKFEITFYFLIFLAIKKYGRLSREKLLSSASVYMALCALVPLLNMQIATNLLCYPFGPYFIFGVALVNFSLNDTNGKRFLLLLLVDLPFVQSTLHKRILQEGYTDLQSVFGSWMFVIFLLILGLILKMERSEIEVTSPVKSQKRNAIGIMSQMTYPLYLFHAETGQPIISLLVRQGLDSRISMAIALILVMLISFFMVKLFDPIARRSLRRLIT
jgi:peptidoglycan/LPS O-acetylase OafA/YrhL